MQPVLDAKVEAARHLKKLMLLGCWMPTLPVAKVERLPHLNKNYAGAGGQDGKTLAWLASGMVGSWQLFEGRTGFHLRMDS